MTELIVERQGAILTCTLNRPDRLNAFSEAMLSALADTLAGAGEDVRAIVIRGAGRAFSAGGDVKAMAQDIAEGRRAQFFHAPLSAIHRAAAEIRAVEKPVIAVLHGAVAGAGLNLALCCDYRVAAENAVLVQAFTNIGLVPDTGGTFMLPRLVGFAKATELLFEGRPVDAAEALRLGLVHQVVASGTELAAGMALAERLASRPTRALGVTKRLLNAAIGLELGRQLDAEQRAQQEVGTDSPDYVEGVQAFCEKREARFRGR